MESPAPRPDEFSLRLAQWLLDQLNSEEELKTVSQQFNVLISQAQKESIEELYLHIGRLIFQKFIQAKTFRSAQICVQLCRSLFMAEIKRRFDHSTRPIPIHDHLFHCCLDHLSSNNFARHSRTEPAADSTTRPNILPESEGDQIAELSCLVLELHKHGLISTAHVYDYAFQLTDRLKSGNLSNLLGAVYALLDGCITRLDANLWEGELEYLRSCVESVASSATDPDSQQGVKCTDLLNRLLNGEQGPDTNSEDPNKRQSLTLAPSIASERTASTLRVTNEGPPGLNCTIVDSKEVARSPESLSFDKESVRALRNNHGGYVHRGGSVSSFDSLKNTGEALTSPKINAGVHHLQLEHYGHSVHPFAIVDSSHSEIQSQRSPPIYPQQHFASSESSFSSAGSAHVLPVPSPSPISTAVATLMLNKKQKKDRLAKLVELRVDQEKKVKEKPEKAKRSKEDTVLDWLEKESIAKGSLDRGKER